MFDRWSAVSSLAVLALTLAPAIAGAQRPQRVTPPPPEQPPAEVAETTVGHEHDEQARAEFDAGRIALEEGHAELALEHFREAHRLSGRPELLYNIALVEDRLRHDREALSTFEQYLVELPLASNRASVESRISVLREEVARQDALAAAPPAPPPSEDLAASPVLWAVVGAIVVAAAVGIGVGVALSADPGTAAPTPGPSGIVISALRF